MRGSGSIGRYGAHGSMLGGALPLPGAAAAAAISDGGALPNPMLLGKTLQAKAQAMLAEKQLEAIEKNVAIAKDRANTASSDVTTKFRLMKLRMLGSFIKNIATLIRNLMRPLGIILKDLSPYIALFVVIMMLFYGYRFGTPKLNFGSSSKRRDEVFNRFKSRWQRFKSWWADKLGILAPGHRYRALMRMLNPLAGRFKKLPRPMMVNGRCDDMEWRELGGDGRAGMCARTYSPKDIQWVMDADKMPELSRMPEALYSKVTNGGRKLQVTIPWALQGTFYVPQCSKATFADGTSAGGLFKDDGMACRKKEVQVPVYGKRYRVKNKAVDDYASESKPKC